MTLLVTVEEIQDLFSDVKPVPQDDGPDPVCVISYPPAFSLAYDYMRARWEQDISASKFDGTANTPNGPFKYWFATQDIDNYDHWSKSTSSLSEGVVINIGVMCESSGISKVICRQYSSSNQLSCVTFHEGRFRE